MRRALILAPLALIASAFAEDEPARVEGFSVPGVTPRAADSDAPLAEGWPKGTAPGTIEVKNYPAYRSAVARGRGAGVGADSVLFYPLFVHITKSNVAMTSPVVSNYAPEMLAAPKAQGDASMEFVYRSPGIGRAGPGVGAVKVEDHPAASYACLGVQGEMDAETLRRAAGALKSWLVDHKADFVEDGPPRRLGYHAPMTPRDERLWEVQVPVKPAPPPAGKAAR